MNISENNLPKINAGVDTEFVTQVVTINPSTGLPVTQLNQDGSDLITYNDSLVANQVVEVSPLSYSAFGLDQYLVNLTNVAAGTAFYPSAAGFRTIPFRKFMLMDFSSGGVTNSIEISPDSTFAAPITLLVQNVTDGTTTASIVDAAGKGFDVLDLCPCYMRIKSVTSDNTNTVKIALTGMSL